MQAERMATAIDVWIELYCVGLFLSTCACNGIVVCRSLESTRLLKEAIFITLFREPLENSWRGRKLSGFKVCTPLEL
jgi:hypothetical protein